MENSPALVGDFRQRLYTLMTWKNWNQSQLAAAAFGTMMNERTGREESKGRDRISLYLRGAIKPSKPHAEKLAAALGVTVEELMPREGLPGQPASQVLRSDTDPENPEYVLLTLNLRMRVAAEIGENLLRDLRKILVGTHEQLQPH